jgi:twitching motility protein PilT
MDGIVERKDIEDMLKKAAEEEVSDIFITTGTPIMFKKDGAIRQAYETRIMPDSAERIIKEIFDMARGQSFDDYKKSGDCDFSLSLQGLGRFRVSAFKQRNSLAAVIRVVKPNLPEYKALGIPEAVIELYKRPRGLTLVTGPTGSGKSTTLASIINLINEQRNCHVLTLEDPIEYLHSHKKGIVNQREMGTDTMNYSNVLRSGLRQAPDVILVGEMRDINTISIALTAAETGTYILSSLHTTGAANSVNRIIDVFPPTQQQQVRLQLSTVLQAVVSQQLLPSPTKGRVVVFEIMIVNSAIRNMIREDKMHQIDNAIHSGAAQGMQLMDYSIAEAYKNGDITKDTALTYCVNQDTMSKYIG